MSNQVSSFVVVLESDLPEENAQLIVSALKQLRGVLSVTAHGAEPLAEQIAAMRVRGELGTKIFDVLYPDRRLGVK